MRKRTGTVWGRAVVVNLQNTDSENLVSSSSAFMPQIGSGSQRVGGTLFHWGANGVRLGRQEGGGMGPLEHANNQELLSALAGKPAAEVLMEQYGGLTPLAQASFRRTPTGQGDREVEGGGDQVRVPAGSAPGAAKACPRHRSWTPRRPIANLLRERNRLYTVEHLQVVFLNTRKRLIGVADLAQGTLDTLLVDAREVFLAAVARRAAAIALVHNHPSGDPTPSEADIKVTRDLIRAGQLLRIEVVDHVILGQRTDERPCDWVSLRQLGYFYT